MASENRELKKAGLKVTAPRLKILSMLSDASGQGDHFSAEDLYQRLRDTGEDIGLATVYRVLTQFESAGLIIRHNFEAGYSVFEMASDHHHDHMVDVDTSEVIEFIDEEIERRQHLIAEQRGYEIIDHSLVLYVRKKPEASLFSGGSLAWAKWLSFSFEPPNILPTSSTRPALVSKVSSECTLSSPVLVTRRCWFPFAAT